MRTWGRVYANDGTWTWIEVSTDSNGNNDQVMLTALAQVLQLNIGESPFYANYGIPAHQSIVTQVFPDFYAALAQQQFAKQFSSLSIIRVPNTNPPQYNVTAVTHSGATLSVQIAT